MLMCGRQVKTEGCAGSVAMLRFLVGGGKAHAVLYDGSMYSAQAASQLGMIDQVSSDEELLGGAREVARRLAAKDAAAFRSIKSLLRAPVANDMARKEQRSVQEFVDIWYSENDLEKSPSHKNPFLMLTMLAILSIASEYGKNCIAVEMHVGV
jgi:1,4-dihydroxy-2-naphthoyl-CoA synthase